jgi:uncharacterized protein YlxW (UPF0749 family)
MSSERDSFAKGIFSTFAKGFLLHKLLLKVNYSPLRVKNPAHMTWAIVTTIDDISKEVKGIKDDVKNLKRRVSDTEKTLNNIENTAITREELGEIQRRRSPTGNLLTMRYLVL